MDGHGVALKSIQESINTSTAAGKIVFHIFGALAEFERNLIRERTKAGLVPVEEQGGDQSPWKKMEGSWLLICIVVNSIP